MMFHFITLFLIHLILLTISVVRTTISLTFLEFSSDTDFGFKIFSVILFPINSPLASAALWTTF